MYEHNGQKIVTLKSLLLNAFNCTEKRAWRHIHKLLNNAPAEKLEEIKRIVGEKVQLPWKAEPEYVLGCNQAQHFIMYFPPHKTKKMNFFLSKAWVKALLGNERYAALMPCPYMFYCTQMRFGSYKKPCLQIRDWKFSQEIPRHFHS